MEYNQWGQFKENQTAVSYLISYIEIFGTVTMMKDEPKRLYEASVRANNITMNYRFHVVIFPIGSMAITQWLCGVLAILYACRLWS